MKTNFVLPTRQSLGPVYEASRTGCLRRFLSCIHEVLSQSNSVEKAEALIAIDFVSDASVPRFGFSTGGMHIINSAIISAGQIL